MPASSSGYDISRRGSGYTMSAVGSTAGESVVAVKVAYKHETDSDVVIKDVTLKVTPQHSVGKAIDKVLKALSGRYPQYATKSAADYTLVVEGQPGTHMPFSPTPLLSHPHVTPATRLLMLHSTDPDLLTYHPPPPPSTHTYVSAPPSLTHSRPPSVVPSNPSRPPSIVGELPTFEVPQKEFSEEREDRAKSNFIAPVRTVSVGVAAVVRMEDDGCQAVPKTACVSAQTEIGDKDTTRLSVDAATLAAELRLFRRRQRVADPVARAADVFLQDINHIVPEYPQPAMQMPYQGDVFHKLEHLVRGLNDPVLNNLATAVDEERENMSATIAALQREAQALRHGWLGEASKVERLKDAVSALVTDRENVLTVLSNSGRLDSEFLARLVNRKLEGELSLINLETMVLKDRVAFYKATDGGNGADDPFAEPLKSPRLDEGRLDEHYLERIRKLEEENDVLAQKVVLHETRDSVVADKRLLHPGDEARVLAEKVVQLEGDLTRERDLRRQYAMQSEVVKQVGMDEIIRQQEHISLQQTALSAVGMGVPRQSSPLRRY